MKIAILGTRGIPNNYGGFEQFAEYLSVGLVKRGHEVTVYNPHFHPFEKDSFEGVHIVKIYSPESKIGSAANFIYDFLCLKHALSNKFDIVYEAGYQSVAFAYPLFRIKRRKVPIIVTNMDGMEWQRTKWSPTVKIVTRKFEALAVKHSHYLISDNKGIANYYQKEYGINSEVLEYGADLVTSFNASTLSEYALSPKGYFMLIARLEPENNIEMAIEAFMESNRNEKLIIVGNCDSEYGQKMKRMACSDRRVIFQGGIYDKSKLDDLRYFAQAYFHGHSVGGTNPSLLEAMASQALIFAHRNAFNRDVLGKNACYFSSSDDLKQLIERVDIIRQNDFTGFNNNNTKRITNYYNWDAIIERHIQVFYKYLNR